MSKTRTTRKPADPRMLVHVPRKAGEDALDLLRKTFGKYPPAPIRVLAESLSDGIARHADVTGKRRPSRFAALSIGSPMTFETKTPAQQSRVKSCAHNWARYHGCHVSTRTTPNGQVMVWLVSRNAR